MKKVILLGTLFFAMNTESKAQSIYTDVYNAYQTLSGNENKTVDTEKSSSSSSSETKKYDYDSYKKETPPSNTEKEKSNSEFEKTYGTIPDKK